MLEKLSIDYLTSGDIYDLQKKTGIQIFFGGEVDERAFSEAIRIMIRRNE